MSAGLHILALSPAVSLQDHGRGGHLATGLSRGGAVDPLALAEGAALIGRPLGDALALEMAGAGGSFRAEGGPVLIALTGAEMAAECDGQPLAWNASHVIAPGEVLKIGGVRRGSYGYLSIAGLEVAPELGARSAHLKAGIGPRLAVGDLLPCASAPADAGGMMLMPEPRFEGGMIRVLPSVQTREFSPETLARLEETEFYKDNRASRMGARMGHAGAGFSQADHLAITSEIIVPGDIQVIGDGAPFVLLNECQTTGGYPRIATVISADLPKVAQAAPGAVIRFRFVDLAEALAAREALSRSLHTLPARVAPRLRDPADMADLLSYQLIGGVISAHEEPDI